MTTTWSRAALLLGLVAVVYANSLGGSFHYDDQHSIVRNPSIRDLANVPAFFTGTDAFSGDADKGMYRPLLLTTLALNYALHGYEVTGFHVVNILLHAACVLLIWRLGVRFGLEGAWVAAALFALHPLATEPVNYISSRSESLMGGLFLLTILLHLRGGRAVWGGRVSLALALLSKETAIVLIPVLLALDLWPCAARSGRIDGWPLLRRHGPYWGIAAAYLGILVWTGFLAPGEGPTVRGGLEQLFTQLKAPAYYLRLLWMPHPLSVDHFFTVSGDLTLTIGAAAALLLSLVVLLWHGRRLFAHATLSGVVALLVLIPTSVIPLNILVNERRLYLVLALLCLGAAGLGRVRLQSLTMAVAVVLALLTVERNQVWATSRALWEDALAHGSRSYTAYANLGKARQEEGDVEGAVAAYRRALSVDDRYGDAYNNLAVLLHEQGNAAAAIPLYEAALARAPALEEIHHNLAVAYQETGDLQGAASSFRRALELDERNGGLWSNFGEFLLGTGDAAGAESAFREAIRWIADRPEPYNGLGNALSMQRRHAEAVRAYGEALAHSAEAGKQAAILANLGESLWRLGQTTQAQQTLRRSVRLAPTAAAHDYLARMAYAAGDTNQARASWQTALQLDPQRRAALTGLGEIAAARGHLTQAAEWLRRAIEAGAGRRAAVVLERVRERSGRGHE